MRTTRDPWTSSGRSRWVNQRTTMKKSSNGQKHQGARPRSRRFAWVCNAVQRGGPRPQMMLISRHSQAPTTK
eukprot:1375160-Pleurochrysis_carterae.AAC.1